MRQNYIPHFGASFLSGKGAHFNLKPMANKLLETAIAYNCTLLTSIKSVGEIDTHLPETKCLIITFTDGLQVEYICPSDGEHYLVLAEVKTHCFCVVLYPMCVPAKLTFETGG